jgi:hypothetical protein
MNVSALLFLVVFWGGIIVLTLFCFYKMLTCKATPETEPEVPFTP